MDFEEALKTVKGLGLKYIEIHALWNKNIENLTNEEIAKAKTLVKNYDLNVSIISSTLFLQCPIYEEDIEFDAFDDYFLTLYGDYNVHLKALQKCIMLCEEFNTNKIRIFGFRKKKEIEETMMLDMISKKLMEPLKYAEKAGVELVLENCPHTYIQSGSLSKRIIESLGSKHIRALWDPGNAYRRGFTPYPDGYNTIKTYISHMHAKNYSSSDSDLPVPFDEGIINYKNILQSLINDGYEGIVSLEPEYISEKGGRIGSNKKCFAGYTQIMKELSVSK